MIDQQEVKLGDVGTLDFDFADGKAIVEVKVAVGVAALEVSAKASIDAVVLIDKLQEAIVKKFPATEALDIAIFEILKEAVKKL